MHPVKFLFEEIYREHWGIPVGEQGPNRKRREDKPILPRLRLSRRTIGG
ncbi:hypothetical protein [Kumtagia ephedrae]|jgi:hypothetical protein|nr:hypothetical protein [Mesorhizobium ephedrae]